MLAHCYDCFSAADGLSSRLPDWPFGLGSIAYLGAAGSLAFGLFDFVAFLRLTHARLAMRQLSA
jgi:hypothetical protein